MCEQCVALEKAHRDHIQTYLRLIAQKTQTRQDGDGLLAEAVRKLNEAWQQLVEHRGNHVGPITAVASASTEGKF